MSINELFNQWQDSIEKALSAEKVFNKETDVEQEQLYEAEGFRLRSGVIAGQLFSLLTICRCED